MARKPILSELRSQLIVAGLVALALLALGEEAPAAFPVHVSIEAQGASMQVSVDGETHTLPSALGGGWRSIFLEQPGPTEREYQIDGSDTTSTNDRDTGFVTGLLGSPVYRFDSWLRDESSYSRWEHLVVEDLSSGVIVVSPTEPLPAAFRLDVDLRRPESPARVWLVVSADRREGLLLDRDQRSAQWVIERGSGQDALTPWFFPEQPMPFVAALLQLIGRSALAGYALVLLALGLGALARVRWTGVRALRFVGGRQRNSSLERGVEVGVGAAVMCLWLVASAGVTIRLYHQLPHILDAVSYTFEAGQLAAGELAVAAPPVPSAFIGPFQVLWKDRIFSQYPPGTPALYALGKVVSLEWLVGPLACAGLIGASAWSARALFGSATGLLVLLLGALSPFVLFQSGSFLSHPLVGGLMAGALAAFVAAERHEDNRWYALTGIFLGAGFAARETASLLFAIPLGLRLLSSRRWGGLTYVIAFGLPFLAAYLVYNFRQTGNPLILPRSLFDASDHFGFGDGIGFYTRHTLAAGLANTDELLTLLQLDLFGWPPLFALGLLAVPFLLGRPGAWDWIAAGGFLAFVVAYVGYFYHGIALGPRYYFEAMPWLLLLAARGAQVLAQVCGTRVAPALLVGALTLNTLLFYTPAELNRRVDFSGLPNGVKLRLGFVQSSAVGPQLDGVPDQSLVLTDDWWIYNTVLSPLNCPRLPDCRVLFALAKTSADADRLRAAYPDRTLLRANKDGGELTLAPF